MEAENDLIGPNTTSILIYLRGQGIDFLCTVPPWQLIIKPQYN